MGGTSTIGCRNRRHRDQYASSWGGNVGCRGSTGACTLLGPEGSEPLPGTVGGSVPRTLAGPLELVSVVRGSTDRMLRTTQWTRASFSSSRHLRVTYLMKKKQCSSRSSFGRDVDNHWSSPPWCRPSGWCRGGRDSYSCMWSSLKEQTVDALATGAEEGRSNLR